MIDCQALPSKEIMKYTDLRERERIELKTELESVLIGMGIETRISIVCSYQSKWFCQTFFASCIHFLETPNLPSRSSWFSYASFPIGDRRTNVWKSSNFCCSTWSSNGSGFCAAFEGTVLNDIVTVGCNNNEIVMLENVFKGN